MNFKWYSPPPLLESWGWANTPLPPSSSRNGKASFPSFVSFYAAQGGFPPDSSVPRMLPEVKYKGHFGMAPLLSSLTPWIFFLQSRLLLFFLEDRGGTPFPSVLFFSLLRLLVPHFFSNVKVNFLLAQQDKPRLGHYLPSPPFFFLPPS